MTAASDSPNKQEITRAPCNRCLQKTRHVVVATRTQCSLDEDPRYGSWTQTYELLECCGCESITLRETAQYSGADDFPDVIYYPPPVSRAMPRWRMQLPPPIRDLLGEIYTALHSGSRRLALMGARTAIDMIALEKLGKVGVLKENLDALERGEFLAPKNRQSLSDAFDAGSAAAHRAHEPTTDQLGRVMDIVENVLAAVFVLGDTGAAIRAATPKEEVGIRLARLIATQRIVRLVIAGKQSRETTSWARPISSYPGNMVPHVLLVEDRPNDVHLIREDFREADPWFVYTR